MINDGFDATDEYVHSYPDSIPTWNESWLLSYCDISGPPAGLFRIGLLPNQNRAWLWLMTVIDGHWLITEETRLPYTLIRTATGVAFEDRDLSFGFEPEVALHSARFHSTCVSRWATGPAAGQLAPVVVDLTVEASGPCFDNEMRVETMSSKGIPEGYSGRRFEQSVRVQGTVTVNGQLHIVNGFGQRDRSWGPRKWSTPFSLGDLNSPDLQLWFATGPDPGTGGLGYIVADGHLEDMTSITGALPADPCSQERGSLTLTAPSTDALTIDVEYLSPPIYFQIAHTQPPHTHYSYYRRLVRGHRTTPKKPPMVGWIETVPGLPLPEPVTS